MLLTCRGLKQIAPPHFEEVWQFQLAYRTLVLGQLVLTGLMIRRVTSFELVPPGPTAVRM